MSGILTTAAEAIDAEGICDTCPSPLDEAEAMRRDYDDIVDESEKESALLWFGVPAAVVVGLAWTAVEFSCKGCV